MELKQHHVQAQNFWTNNHIHDSEFLPPIVIIKRNEVNFETIKVGLMPMYLEFFEIRWTEVLNPFVME